MATTITEAPGAAAAEAGRHLILIDGSGYIILDGGTGTPNNPMPSEPAAEFAQRKAPPSKQTPNLKKDQMVYLSQP